MERAASIVLSANICLSVCVCLAKSPLYTVCAVSLCVSAELKVKPPHSLLPHSSTEYKQ